MASTSCWKCLLRPSISPANAINNGSRLPSISAFSTSASVGATAVPKKTGVQKNQQKNMVQKNQKTAKTLRIKKKAHVKTGRPPAPGERKALRNRIVLSNTNAIEVQGLEDMTSKAVLDTAQIGKVLSLPGLVVDQLRAVEAFKTTQAWPMFRKPAMLMRTESVQISKMMHVAQTEKSTALTVIDGGRGTGKSLVLLQAMTTAFLKGWIVVNIPEARFLTTATTEYSPIPGTTPALYSQNTHTAAWLGQIAKANSAVLASLQLSQKHNLPIPLQDNISLGRLAELGARDPDIAWPVFQAFWTEITSAGRPPVLLAVDGLVHFMTMSAYRNPDFELIHAHDLAIVKLFIDYLSGLKQFPNGGAVLAATSTGTGPVSYAMSLAIKQKEEKLAGKEVSMADPFTELDPRSYDSLQAANIMKLKGISKPEARGLMEYWAASGVLRQRVDEKIVAEKWMLAGHGIVGEIERSMLRMRI